MFRQLMLACLMLIPMVGSAADVKHRFVTIDEPIEQDKFITNITNIGGSGYFFFLDNTWRPEDLRIRIRVYRPVNGDFELFHEQDAEIGRPLPNEPATLQYVINIKPKKAPKPGKYLYRVDCLDTTDKEEKLLASNSMIMTFVELEKRPGVQAGKPRLNRIPNIARATSRRASRNVGAHNWRGHLSTRDSRLSL